MKKLSVLIALMICAVCTAGAQSFSSDSRYVGATVTLQDGGVPLSLYYEQAVHENIGVGGMFGFTLGNVSGCSLAARANYHFLEHIVTGTKWDAYGGAALGLSFFSSATNVFFNLQVGSRYCFNDKWAALAEIGVGLVNSSNASLSLGATYSF